MDKTKKELLEEMFPEVAAALKAIFYAGAPISSRVMSFDIMVWECAYCGEEKGHDDDCAYKMAENAWEDLD